MQTTAPLAAVVATRDRPDRLAKTLESLLEQNLLPKEFVVVDASTDGRTETVVDGFRARCGGEVAVRLNRAKVLGAAAQRNQGVGSATQPYIWFVDDDVSLYPKCVSNLWEAL